MRGLTGQASGKKKITICRTKPQSCFVRLFYLINKNELTINFFLYRIYINNKQYIYIICIYNLCIYNLYIYNLCIYNLCIYKCIKCVYTHIMYKCNV